MKLSNVSMRKILTQVIAITVLGITIYFLTSILEFKSPHGIDQLEGIYWQPQDSINVVVMGTSHVHCGVNTGILWEKYSIPAYDYSGAEQPLWMTYYYLKELFKYQSPEVVVVDMYGPARYKEDYQYEWISENIHGMKFSFNKLEMLFSSVEFEKITKYFPSFMIYHNRYDDLNEEDFTSFFWNEKEKEDFKGYTPYWNKRAQICPEDSTFETVEPGGLTLKSEKYLRKIIRLAKEKECKLIFTVIPYIETPQDRETYLEIEEIAEEEGIQFINYNEYYDEIGLDFNNDFNDESHLNYWGSCKFTDHFGSFLATLEGTVERNPSQEYESWDDNVTLILDELESYENGLLEELE